MSDDGAGTMYLTAGYGYMRAASSETRVLTRVTQNAGTAALGIPESFRSRDVDLRQQPASTLVLSAGWFATDQLAISLDAGVPPEIEVQGKGMVGPPGPAGETYQLDLSDPQINPLGKPRQWSPVLGVQYRFGEPGSFLRPYVGAGVTYTWFTQQRLNPAFAEALDEQFGQPLATAAGKPGPTSPHVRVDPFWTWALAAGARASLGKRWGLSASVGYAPLAVKSVLTMRAQDGSVLSRSYVEVDVDGVVATLGIDYRFRAL